MKASRTLPCLGALLLLAACGSPSPHSAATAPPAPGTASATPAAPSAPAKEPGPKIVTAPEPKIAKPDAAKPAARLAPPAVTPAKPAPAAAPAPALDLKTLEQRLKETGAVGVLTKLSLKNQVDDLVARFRAFHAGTRPPTLAELRPAFDLLLMKVMSLLQDGDAALARDIQASREAIWGVLADAGKLARYN